MLPRRNKYTVQGDESVAALGVRAWGDITMTDNERWKERRDRVARYRVMEQETTDPLAAGLLHDIVLELEADLTELAEIEAQRILIRDCALEPGVIEFHGRTVSCLVRSLNENGATLDVISPRNVPDHFTLALPLEGTSHRCQLVWRREMEVRVTFQRSEISLM